MSDAETLGRPAGGRRGSRSALLWVSALAAVVVVGASIYGYRLWDARSEATRLVSEATALIEEADVVVVAIDEVIRSEISTASAAAASEAASRVPVAVTSLRDAATLLDEATPKLRESERERVGALKLAAEARLDMLAQAPAILEATVKASTALPLADPAWQRALEADKLSKQAVAQYNKLTRAGVRASRDLNKKAAAELAAAREGFEAAEKAFPEAAFETYLAYLDARVELNRLSQQSDAAWLEGEFEKANRLIAQYNEKDKRAVALAKQLPASPSAAIAAAYEALAKAATEEYYAARDRATEADSKVRRF